MNKLPLIFIILLTSACQKHSKNQETVENTSSTPAKPIISDQFIDGQPVEYYLNSDDMDKIVLDYYYGRLDIKENEQTGDLLNALIEQKGDLVPMYYRCFMNICKNNGANLQNYLGNYCIKLLEQKTYYCVKKLRQGAPDYFTGLVANEIYKKPNWEEEINNISLKLHLNLENEAPELRKELDLFIVGLKNDIEHLSRR